MIKSATIFEYWLVVLMATALLHRRWNADIQFIYFQTQSLTSQCFHTNFLEYKSWSIFQTKTNLTKRYPIGFSMVASTNLHRKKSESEWVRGRDRDALVEMAQVWLRNTFRSIAKLLIFVQKDKKMWAQQKTLRNCIGVQFYSVSLIFLWFLLMRFFYVHEKIWSVCMCAHTRPFKRSRAIAYYFCFVLSGLILTLRAISTFFVYWKRATIFEYLIVFMATAFPLKWQYRITCYLDDLSVP